MRVHRRGERGERRHHPRDGAVQEAGAGKKLVVTGCLAQRYADELAKDIPEIDHILGSSDFPSIAKVARSPSRGARARRKTLPVVQVTETPAYIYDHEAPRVRIGAGPLGVRQDRRGLRSPVLVLHHPEAARPAAQPPDRGHRRRGRARSATQGVREINLIAQDLTRYGWDAGSDPASRQTLAQLLRALGKVDGVDWIRLHYTFPSAFDDDLIDAIASEPKVVKYIDVPLQHISDAMLKRMRRGHSSRITRELVKKLRERIDNVVLRTTFIVGHPGETDAEFDELCEFVAESKFDRAGAFTYSIEPGTVSAMLPNRVDPDGRRGAPAEADGDPAPDQPRAPRSDGRQGDRGARRGRRRRSPSTCSRAAGTARRPASTASRTSPTARCPPGSLVRARVTQASDYDLAASLEL